MVQLKCYLAHSLLNVITEKHLTLSAWESGCNCVETLTAQRRFTVKQNKQQGSGQRQQNKSGQCRRSSSGFGKGTGICRAQNAERFQAESVITADKASNKSSLQLLEQQAERMAKALEEIQARIKSIGQQ